MKLKIVSLGLVALMAAMLFMVSTADTEAAAPATSTATIPVTGTATNALGQVINFTGTLSNLAVTSTGGALSLAGTLTGTATNTATGATQAITQTVSALLTASGSCQVLDLTIGAINLNLLGVVITTNTIHLNITAQSGPGNLLGNLVCAVAHLLDSNGALVAVSNLLNNVLGQLTGSLGGLII